MSDLYTCDDGHKEVCYSTKGNSDCPVCEKQRTIEELIGGLDKLKEQLEQLKNK